MTTSLSTDYSITRDEIITRALRICNALGQGETATTTQISETAVALNMIIKELQTEGMQLWKRYTDPISPVASQRNYSIPVGPTKVLRVWYRTDSSDTDQPMMLITKDEYDMLSDKLTTGVPTQAYYEPPGANLGVDTAGTLFVYLVPDATFASDCTLYYTGIAPIEDFDAGTDNPDFPSYYYNALTWLLADEISMENGVPPSDRAQISQKSQYHYMKALAGDSESGSIFIQPDWRMV
jgi:hypothetical protein